MTFSPMLASVRVLVVDSETESRELIVTLLTHSGAHVTPAASVDEALALLDQQSFHVLLADISRPQQNGYDLIREVRKREQAQPGASQRLPAVAATTQSQAEERIRLLQAGYQTHLLKPIDPEELVCVVAALADWGGGLPRS